MALEIGTENPYPIVFCPVVQSYLFVQGESSQGCCFIHKYNFCLIYT